MAFSFRYLRWVSLVWLLHCGPIEDEEVAPAAPPVDREGWNVKLELSEPGLRIDIQAAYVRDDLERQMAYADSGVLVSFRDAGGSTQVQARRLTLDHRADRIGLGGGVVLSAGDSLQVQADTLIWDGEEERLWVPGKLRIVADAGEEQGRELRTSAAVREWSMEGVTGTWRSREPGADYEVRLRARRERSRRAGEGLVVVYDSVEVECDGALIRSARARYSQAEGFMFFLDGVSGADSAREFRAREMDFDLGGRQTAARGAVEFSEPDLDLQADEVVEDREREHLQARGKPARFAQEQRLIEAGLLDYAEASGRLEASDQVVFREAARTLRAARLVYRSAPDSLHAAGNVSLQAPEFDGMMSCGSLTYDLETEQGTLTQDPVLRRAAGDGEELTIRAPELRFDLRRQLLAGEGEFRMAAGDLNLRADRGRYEAETERLLLAGGAALDQKKAAEDYRSQIQADSMVVQLEGGEVGWIQLPGEVKGTIESSAQRRNWIRGRHGRLFFQERRLQRVELESNADVTHRHLGKDQVSRFRGAEMELHFDADGLRRVWVGGGAELLSRLPPEDGDEEAAINRVEGEELEILFEDGTIAQVRMGPAIEGRYYPRDEDEK